MKSKKEFTSRIKIDEEKNSSELKFYEEMSKYFMNSEGTIIEKLQNFPKYVPRQDITHFLTKYELFKKILDVEGSIVELGVLLGGGLMSWAHYSSIFEHVNYRRKIIGFDTFSKFPPGSKYDDLKHLAKNKLYPSSLEDIQKAIDLYDLNRFLPFLPKVQLVKGNIKKTVPKYLKENPHTIVSLLYIDTDIFEPAKVAIENFLPCMPKGSIIAFDELNDKEWMGETIAVAKTIGINNLKIKRFPFDTRGSYAILE